MIGSGNDLERNLASGSEEDVGPKREKGIYEWRKLHEEEIQDLLLSVGKRLRGMRWKGMWNVWGRREIRTGFGGETQRKDTTWKKNSS
jgi:hypothetical protein